MMELIFIDSYVLRNVSSERCMKGMDENLYIFRKKYLKAPKFEITVVQMWNFNLIACFFHEKLFSPPFSNTLFPDDLCIFISVSF